VERVKYPRTRHLPHSPGVGSDDLRLSDLSALVAGEVVVTEKMDGENTTIGPGYVHARSLDSTAHESRTRVRALAGRIGHEIPAGMRVCGENLYARHSIGYDRLAAHFLVFNIWQDDVCLDWDGTQEWADLLGLHCVPELYRGEFPGLDGLTALWRAVRDRQPSEGYVVRTTHAFNRDQFGTHLAKWVRSGHVQTGQHWMTSTLTPNRVAEEPSD